MPTLTVPNYPEKWVTQAPVVITNTFDLPASKAQVFAVLADIDGWSAWFKGMRKIRIDGAAQGVGALRTVWVGATNVQERFVVWEPDERVTFAILRSNAPGLASMVEDWALGPDPAHPDDPARCRLTVTVGIEPARLLKPFKKLVHSLMSKAMAGGAGIASQFS
jgi:hypothetical protein